jgi:hypothetical protein
MRRFVVREVVINVHYENGQIGLEIAKGFAGTDDESLRDAIVFRDPFASKAGASLATTAMLLASEFTKRGEWRKRGPAQTAKHKAASAAWWTDADARRAAYWATRGENVATWGAMAKRGAAIG